MTKISTLSVVLTTSLILMPLLATSPAMAQTNYVKRLLDLSDKFTTIRSKLSTADDSSSWIPFVESERSGIQKDVDGYLDKAITILLDDSIIQKKNTINDLYAENKKLEGKISDLTLMKMSAPGQKKFYEVWKDTTNDVDDKIAKAKAQIDKNKRVIANETDNIYNALLNAKINITLDQVKQIFITTSGEDQLESLVVLKNLYAISDILKNTVTESSNLSVSKKYYGIFLLATEAHNKQLVNNLENITNLYIPRLTQIQEENFALMKRTREMAASNPQYEKNLIAQQQTQDVAIKYQQLLRLQTDYIINRINALDAIIKFTENSYQTAAIASSLSDTMDQSVNSLLAILEMPIFPPMQFENALEAKFQEISAKLAAK